MRRLRPLAAGLFLALGGAGAPGDGAPPGGAVSAAAGPPLPSGWCGEGRPTALATQAIALLRAATDHGLLPSDYDAEPLAATADRLRAAAAPARDDCAGFERAIGTALTSYLTDVHRGRVDPRQVGFDYHAGESHRIADLVASALERGDLAPALAEAEPAYPQYRRLKAALAPARRLAAEAPPPPLPRTSRVAPGDAYTGLAALAARLRRSGDLPDGAPVAEGDRYAGAIVEAVRRFQARHGLAADGILGRATVRELEVPPERRVRQIELALERLRWLPHAPAGRFLVANVPAYRLVAFDGLASDRPALQSAIVVGKAARTRTPLFADAVRYLIFRPFWYPPRSIIVKEIVPLLRRDPGYLARERLDLVARGADDAAALPATPANLARLAAGSLQLRQRPGPHNALGLVKFVFPNRYDVYLHDTPAKGLFARARRDFSHGCIRVEKPAELAAFLLAGGPEWTAERIRAALDGERTFRVDLPLPVPLFIYYTTAIVRQDGTVEFFDDVYGRDEALQRALRAGR
jgi:murein L,D-transpeptidase YcbB/YkuD